jgi:hypothetical protein
LPLPKALLWMMNRQLSEEVEVVTISAPEVRLTSTDQLRGRQEHVLSGPGDELRTFIRTLAFFIQTPQMWQIHELDEVERLMVEAEEALAQIQTEPDVLITPECAERFNQKDPVLTSILLGLGIEDSKGLFAAFAIKHSLGQLGAVEAALAAEEAKRELPLIQSLPFSEFVCPTACA